MRMLRSRGINGQELFRSVGLGLLYVFLGFMVGRITVQDISAQSKSATVATELVPQPLSAVSSSSQSVATNPQAPAAAAAAAVSVNPVKSQDQLFVHSPFRHLNLEWTADQLWDGLLKNVQNPQDKIVVEVGCYDGLQCKAAADRGFKQVICIEASPANHAKTQNTVAGLQNVKLLFKAATSTDGGQIQFHSTNGGGTGDHAGPQNPDEVVPYGEAVSVGTVMLDTIIQEYPEVYLIKIDTQGHDGLVLAGLEKSLKERKVKFVMIELWPKAMKNAGRTCEDTLHSVLSFGYSAYETKLNWLSAPSNKDEILRGWLVHGARVADFCKFYMDNSEGFGLWTDLLLIRDHV